MLAKPVDLYVWQAPINGVSEVLETDFGFHLVTVSERTISDVDKYEQSIRDRVFGTSEHESQNGDGADEH